MHRNEFTSVSVVIPCFRCTGTIERAVASVAAQTRRPAEVILVDDASGDDTQKLLQKLSQHFEPGWIKLVFLEQNVGAASARNAGWDQATQTYVAFLDADDAWHPKKIVPCNFLIYRVWGPASPRIMPCIMPSKLISLPGKYLGNQKLCLANFACT